MSVMTAPASARTRFWLRRAILLLALAAAAAGLVVLIGSEPRPAAPAVPRPVAPFTAGSGTKSARVLPATDGKPGPTVIFLHGWGLVGPDAYRAWIDHLRERGATVIVPRYQRDLRTWSPLVPDAALDGVESALSRLPDRPRDVVVAGHSAGGILAVDYAARARRRGLPPARAVLAVYPGGALRDMPPLTADAGALPRRTRLVVMESSEDAVVGTGPAEALLEDAAQLPDSQRSLILVDDAEAGDHFAPAGDSAAARRVFWPVLDRLISEP